MWICRIAVLARMEPFHGTSPARCAPRIGLSALPIRPPALAYVLAIRYGRMACAHTARASVRQGCDKKCFKNVTKYPISVKLKNGILWWNDRRQL